MQVEEVKLITQLNIERSGTNCESEEAELWPIHFFLNKLIKALENENNYSEQQLIQKLNDIDENQKCDGKSLCNVLRLYLLICLCI